jgi:hypothetical protein
MKCGGKARQEVNIVNVSVLEGTVEKWWNNGTVKWKLFVLEIKIENIKYMVVNVLSD